MVPGSRLSQTPVLMHGQFVPNGTVYTDLVFDDKGMECLVADKGDVT